MTRSALVLCAAVSLATATPALAQTVTNPASVTAGTYAIEPGHTQIGFSVLHFGFTWYSGSFSNVSGKLSLDPKKPAASELSVTIPIASVQTTSDKLTSELKDADWFDAAKFPDATFVSTSVVPTGKGEATVTGNLTLHGVTKTETLKVKFLGAGTNPIDHKYTVGFDAAGIIKRSDFGVTKYVPYVSDEVRLHIAGAFEKQD